MSNISNTNNIRITQQRRTWMPILVLLCLMQLCPDMVMVQLVPRDIPTIEAYINDHKKQRSLLLARSTLEESNKLLQKRARQHTANTGISTLSWTNTPVPSTLLTWSIVLSAPASMSIAPTTRCPTRLGNTNPFCPTSMTG